MTHRYGDQHDPPAKRNPQIRYMLAWDACTSEPNALLRWIECHPALGSYLTLGAIAAAIWATFKTIGAERKRVIAQGRVIAFRLSPVVISIHADIERALQCVTDLEQSSNDMSKVSVLIQNLYLPTQIPDDIFRDSWTMQPEIALFVAKLESALANYATVMGQPLGSIGVIPQQERSKILNGIRAMLREIDALCLIISNHCTKVAMIAVTPYWRRWFVHSSNK